MVKLTEGTEIRGMWADLLTLTDLISKEYECAGTTMKKAEQLLNFGMLPNEPLLAGSKIEDFTIFEINFEIYRILNVSTPDGGDLCQVSWTWNGSFSDWSGPETVGSINHIMTGAFQMALCYEDLRRQGKLVVVK